MDIQPKESRLEEFITDPKKAMWKLALPMTFGMAVQAIYMLADTAFVGRMIGGTALAALGYVFPFLFIIMGITFGVGSGATTVIAQFIGAKDKKNADIAAEHTIVIGLIIGELVWVLGYLALPPIVVAISLLLVLHISVGVIRNLSEMVSNLHSIVEYSLVTILVISVLVMLQIV